MKVITNRLITWLMAQTRIVRYLVIAVMIHVLIAAFLGTRKIVAILPKIIAVFDAPALPQALPDQPDDPFAVYRDFEYTGPTLGGGGGTDRKKGPGGTPEAGGTPDQYTAHILTEQARVTEPASISEVIGVFSDVTTDIARPTAGPGAIVQMGAGMGDTKLGMVGVKGPGGGLLSARLGPARSVAIQKYGGSAATEQAVLAALRWLKNNQRNDGSWKCYASDQGGTALALLAFLGHNEKPDSAEFGPTVQKALEFLVTNVDNQGMVHGRNMYAQGLVTLALAEAYTMTESPAVREPLERLVGAIVKTQRVHKDNPKDIGGWRYTTVSNDSDTSVTGWMVMGLKSARNAGIEVPQQTFDAAAQYFWNMYSGPGFGYSVAQPETKPGTTAIGVLCMQFLGHGSDRRVKTALEYLRRQQADWQQTRGNFVMYWWYYITHAMFQAGGSDWTYWNRQIQSTLVHNQLDDGRWPVPTLSEAENKDLSRSPVYATALGALTLEVYYRYLPLYDILERQREGTTQPALPQIGPLPGQ
jgi:hypothetical protein